jgi:hypothetical protein
MPRQVGDKPTSVSQLTPTIRPPSIEGEDPLTEEGLGVGAIVAIVVSIVLLLVVVGVVVGVMYKKQVACFDRTRSCSLKLKKIFLFRKRATHATCYLHISPIF